MIIKLVVFRSSLPEVFSTNNTLQTCSKPTEEQPCKSVIPTKPLCNLITPTYGCFPENSQLTRRTPSSRKTPLVDCFSMSEEF